MSRSRASRAGELFPNLDEVRQRHRQHPSADWGGFARASLLGAFALGLFVYGLWSLGFSWAKILNGLGELGTFAKLMVPPDYGTTDRLLSYLRSLGETVAIAFLGTLLAAVLAFPLSFLAARNAMANRVLHFLSRRFFDTVRSVDTLIWALIWINVVGLGPFAGILAIATADFGVFGKLFSEAIETADRKPVEGIMAVGGSRLEEVRFGIIPQVLPVLASQLLYYFESNTRSATIIGIVGAGGIGFHLYEQIKILEWQHVSFLVLLILVAVAIIDSISSRLRFALIGRRPL